MLFKILYWCRVVLCLALLIVVANLTRELVTRSAEQQTLKYDFANIYHMKYSLFSVNNWKNKIGEIVVQEIKNFKVDDKAKDTLKKHLETQLDVLIDKVNTQIRESNKTAAGGWFKQYMMDMLVNVQDIKKGIPDYADAAVKQMTAESTQGQVKDILKTRITKYLRKTYDKMETAEVDAIIARTGGKDIEEARAILGTKVPIENQNL